MEVRVLGALEVTDGSTAVRLAPAERTLLAALASRSGERVAVDVLEEAMWPGQRPPTARKSLQAHIARLRRALGATSIIERSGGYLLDPDQIEVDAARVAAQVNDARAAIAGGDQAAALAVLDAARSAFRGEPYADVPETALPAGEVHRLQELHAAVVEEAFEVELAAGCGGRHIGELEAWLEHNPFRERAWGQLMRALYQSGRSADALAAYGKARLVLAAELGLEPGPALRELERAILTHDRRLLGDSGAVLGASNVPAALGPIIGRRSELAFLERLCEENRLVTLTGAGGIGKTRLAVELASRLAGRDEHGPYFVDLVPVASAALAPTTLAAALGVDVEAHDDVMERVRSALGNQSVLVVVDNCEHLLPDVAASVAELLSGNAGVRVVATSREPLEVAGERVFPLSPLAVPPTRASREQIESSDAGALFLARLPIDVASRPFTAEDVDAASAVCRSLDGIPLGLELAAARTRTFSLPELATRLERSIGELTHSGHGVVPRHRTMHAALDWGARLLSEPARTALWAMSVFSGGCELDAFAAVCVDADSSAEALLDELVRTSFLTVDFEARPTRYRLLEPVRQYAAEQLDRIAQRDERRQRHLEHYLDLALTLHGGGYEPVEPTPFEPWKRELGNLRVALDWATAAVERADAGLVLVSAAFDVWAAEARQLEGVEWTIKLLGSGGGSPDARSRAAREAGILAAWAEEMEQCRALLEQALSEALAGASDPVYEGRARQVLAHAYAEAGDIEAARQQVAASMELRTERDEEGLPVFCLASKALVEMMAGRLDVAESACEQILASGFGADTWPVSTAKDVLGLIMLERGDIERSRAWSFDALAAAESVGDNHDAIGTHIDAVTIECVAGRLDEAEAHFVAAVELSAANDRTTVFGLLFARAELALYGADSTRAAELAAAALGRANEMSSAHDRCKCLRRLGDAELAGDPEGALSTFQQLIARARGAPYPCREAEGHEGAAAAAEALGRHASARRHLAAADEIRRRTGTRRTGRPWLEAHLARVEAGGASDQLSESGR